MTKNERIAELEREVAELRLELQRLAARAMPMPMMPQAQWPIYHGGAVTPNQYPARMTYNTVAAACYRPEIAHFTYENGRTKFLAMERA